MAYFPPLSHTFHRLRVALSDTFPELIETLNPAVNPTLLASFEAELGCPLPPPVRDSFLIADGQDLDSGNSGLFFGLHLLPLEEVVREWTFWRQAEHDPMAGKNPAVLATMASVPPKWIKSLYACRGWLPLITDHSGNYVGVDLDPGSGGAWGQVIVFGRDFDRKCVLWRGDGDGGWGKWLAAFVDELESGEGWEAEKSNSSDDEEDVGYESYNGGAKYGESGRGLRLAGEYKGWNVMEAWWDKSVRKWEGLGLGLDVEAVERGLEEARRLAGLDDQTSEDVKGKGKQREERGLGIKTGDRIVGEIPGEGDLCSAQTGRKDRLISVFTSTVAPQPPGTPVPRDSDSLLPPASPDHNTIGPIPRIQHPSPSKSPIRVITPITTTTEHPLKANRNGGGSEGFLSPPTLSPPRPGKRNARTPPAPAPSPLDLPTRADVQAMSAIARAETSGLRGGWVMNLDTSSGSAHRRAQAATAAAAIPLPFSAPNSRTTSPNLPNMSPNPYRHSLDAEMVDIDLEGGKAERFGSPHMSDVEHERQLEEEKLSLAGLEHRRSPLTSPQLGSSSNFSRPVSPSPLGMGIGMGMGPDNATISNPYDYDEPTPRALPREEAAFTTIPPSVMAATNALRRPPPTANPYDASVTNGTSGGGFRSITPEPVEREQDIIRGSRRISMPRAQRESSIASEHSQDGLLDGEGDRDRERWRMSQISNTTSSNGNSASNSRQSSPRPSGTFTTTTSTVGEYRSQSLASPIDSPLSSATSGSTPTFADQKPLPTPTSTQQKQAPVTQTHARGAGSIVAARKKALEEAMQEVQLEGASSPVGKRGSRVVVGKR